jgi:hypothetical protein
MGCRASSWSAFAPPHWRRSRGGIRAAQGEQQQLWIETRNQDVLTTAIESGHDTFLFGPDMDTVVSACEASTHDIASIGKQHSSQADAEEVEERI